MRFIILIGLFFVALNAQQTELNNVVRGETDICYGELGCFTTRSPFGGTFQRPIAFLPEAPEKINTTFLLFTKANPTTPIYLTHEALDPAFRPSKPTKIIIHGFVDYAFNKHHIEVKDALLTVGDFNVIIIDWSKGNGLPYTQATANTQVVGAVIARFINTYAKNYNLDVANVHLIGHSLGAHTAGYAGQRIPNLGRITALDPAGPYFENTDKIVRLDESDANFVDVIHSDGSANLLLGLGLMQKLGHVDFYVNGGKDQPNCPPTSWKLLQAIFNLVTIDVTGAMDTLGCSHMAAVYFFRDSIINSECKYTAYPCKSHDEFNKGNCLSCSVFGCNQMGFWATPTKDQGSLYLNTQDAYKYPYCEYPYSIKLNSNDLSGQNQAKGVFKIVLNGEKGSSLPLTLDDSEVTFKAGSSEIKLVPSTKYIGENVVSATISYTKTSNFLIGWMYQDEWSFKEIEILYGSNQNTVRLCPDQQYIISGSNTVNFIKC